MKKVLLLLVLAILSVSCLLTSCEDDSGIQSTITSTAISETAETQPEGQITITVNVVIDGQTTPHEIKTKESKLGNAIADHIVVDSTGYITTVWGKAAESSKQEWWSILINSEFGLLAVKDQPIVNGDVITLELMVGW